METLKKLLDVKSFVTMVLTLVVAYLAIIGEMDIKDLYLIVVSFYFGTQHQKGSERLERDSTYQ